MKDLDDYYLKSDLKFHFINNRDLIKQIIETKYNINANQFISKSDIEILEFGMRHSWEIIYNEICGALCFDLSANYPEIQSLIIKLLSDKNYGIRLKCIIASQNCKDNAFNIDIYRIAISDKSSVVVLQALFQMPDDILKTLIPEIEEAKTRFPKNKNEIDRYIKLAVNGYSIGIDDTNYISLVFRYKNEYIYKNIEKGKFSKLLIPEYIKELFKN